MKQTTGNKKSYILTFIISFIIFAVIATVITVAFINIIPDSVPSENEPPATEPPALPSIITLSNIDIELLNTNFVFNYTATNLGNYSVSITISNPNIASIDDNRKIIPHQIGTTKIITSVNTTPKTERETTLNIVDCVKDASFNITDSNGNIPQVLLTDTTYNLQITQNIADNYTPTLSYSSNIQLQSNLKQINNIYSIAFKIIEFGNFDFNYEAKYIEKSYTNYCYKLPTDFNVSFSNILLNNNAFDLYLFNKDNIENDMTIFDETSFTIMSQPNTYDNIILHSYTDGIIKVVNNKITALKEGVANICFYSTVSKIYKTYTINISKYINLIGIKINGIPKALNTIDEITISTGQPFSFVYNVLPQYSLALLNLNYDENILNYVNQKFSFNSNVKTTTITLSHNESIVYTLHITQEPEIFHYIYLASKTHEATYIEESRTLTATLNDNCFVILKCAAYMDETKTEIQKFEIESKNSNICTIDGSKIVTGNINLKIVGIGETEINVKDLGNNISFNIKVIVK